MPATNLAGYYSGLGQSLPSLSSRANSYASYGLGNAGSYMGTAAQNTALLNKLQSSGGSSPSGQGYSASPAPAATSPSGGFGGGSVPAGDASLSGDISSLNDLQGQYQQLTKDQASQLMDPSQRGSAAYENNVIANAYSSAVQQALQNGVDITGDRARMVAIENALNGAQNSAAAVQPNTIGASRGSFANNEQVGTQTATNAIPYAEQVAQLSANLAPAENAYNADVGVVQNINGNIVSGAQLEQQGFTAGQQLQLRALESKIAQGQALTNDEYSAYTSLKSAQIGAAAQVQAAGIGAGATIQAANIQAANALKIAALQNPGIGLKTDANGNFLGTSFLTNPSTASSIGSSKMDLNSLKNLLSTQLQANPSNFMQGNDQAIINNLMAIGGISGQDASNLFYTMRKPYEQPTLAVAAPQPSR